MPPGECKEQQQGGDDNMVFNPHIKIQIEKVEKYFVSNHHINYVPPTKRFKIRFLPFFPVEEAFRGVSPSPNRRIDGV